MCFVWLAEETVTIPLCSINRSVFITEAESVYSAVRTECLYKTDTFYPSRVNWLALRFYFQHGRWHNVSLPHVTVIEPWSWVWGSSCECLHLVFALSGSFIYNTTSFFKPNGRYIDYLSFTCATSKDKNIESYTIYITFKKRGGIKNIKTIQITTKVLMISSSHEVVTKRKVSIPSFLSWPPSIAHTLSHWIMRYIVQDGAK